MSDAYKITATRRLWQGTWNKLRRLLALRQTRQPIDAKPVTMAQLLDEIISDALQAEKEIQ
jgi:hypothetical protein